MWHERKGNIRPNWALGGSGGGMVALVVPKSPSARMMMGPTGWPAAAPTLPCPGTFAVQEQGVAGMAATLQTNS